MATQAERGARFQELHEGAPFVIPNPWDVGSARVLQAHGFQALATTSSGFAFTLGRLDGSVTLDEVVAHVGTLAQATDLPISVDLENGYGAEPSQAASAISRVAEAGAVGGSIDDWDPSGHLYELPHAVERVATRREHEQRNRRARADAAAELEPVHVGQHEIEDGGVEGIPGQQPFGLRARGCG